MPHSVIEFELQQYNIEGHTQIHKIDPQKINMSNHTSKHKKSNQTREITKARAYIV